MWTWLELVGEQLGLLGWWKGRVDMYGLNVGDGKAMLVLSSMHLVAGQLQAEAVLAGLLLSSDPLVVLAKTILIM